MPKLDLTGQRFGNLVVTGPGPRHVRKGGNTVSRWFCRCDCGGQALVCTNDLRRGHNKTCGCKITSATYGLKKAGIWSAFQCMLQAQGKLPVHEPWINNPASFMKDLGPRPGPGYQLRRKVSRLGYVPENLAWVSPESVRVTYQGRCQTIKDWCRELGLSYPAVVSRLERGWTVQDAFTKVIRSYHKGLTYKGETRTLAGWSSRLGFKKTLINNRLRRGWSVDRALSTPADSPKTDE